jgi:hypothetical protein
MSKKSSITRLILVAAITLPCVAIGAFLREHSPNFDKWSNEYMAGIDPSHGVALAFASWWPLVTFFWFLGFMLFIATLVVMSWIVCRVHRQVLRLLSVVVFVLPTAWAATIIIFDLFRNIRWGFYFMAFGELLTVVALLLGIWQIIARVREKRPNQALLLI